MAGKNNLKKKVVYLIVCFSLFLQQIGFAQMAAELNIVGYLAGMHSSIAIDKFRPLRLRYFSYDINSDNFKFLFDRGDLKQLEDDKFKSLSSEVLQYFLIGIALPDDKFWVNLRPDSESQIIEPELELTDLGKVFLEADLQLKKDTAKYTSPETPEGREYWNKLYKKAEELFGYEAITIPTLTRPWIVPGEIIVRETQDSAFIYKSTLKVMLEHDHLKGSVTYSFKDERMKALNEYSSLLIRELIIPKLTKEVNISKKYAPLRQVFYSLILARWFKARFGVPVSQSAGESVNHLTKKLENQLVNPLTGKPVNTYLNLIDSGNLTNLTSTEPWSKTTYFKEYQKSFNDGEYNLKESVYTPTGQAIRSYFSGGIKITMPAQGMVGYEARTREQNLPGKPNFIPATLDKSVVPSSAQEEVLPPVKVIELSAEIRKGKHRASSSAASPIFDSRKIEVDKAGATLLGNFNNKQGGQRSFLMNEIPESLKNEQARIAVYEKVFELGEHRDRLLFTIIFEQAKPVVSGPRIWRKTENYWSYGAYSHNPEIEISYDSVHKNFRIVNTQTRIPGTPQENFEVRLEPVTASSPLTLSQARDILNSIRIYGGARDQVVVSYKVSVINDQTGYWGESIDTGIRLEGPYLGTSLYPDVEEKEYDYVIHIDAKKLAQDKVSGEKLLTFAVDKILWEKFGQGGIDKKKELEALLQAKERGAASSAVSSAEIVKRLTADTKLLSAFDGIRDKYNEWINTGDNFRRSLLANLGKIAPVLEEHIKIIRPHLKKIFDDNLPQDMENDLTEIESAVNKTVDALRNYSEENVAYTENSFEGMIKAWKKLFGALNKIIAEGQKEEGASASSAVKTGTETSSPVNPGGIDFRVMNIVTQPLVASSGLNLKLPRLADVTRIDLDEEFRQIQDMLKAGIAPSGGRIKEYLAACRQKGEWDNRIADIISSLVEICRLEEEAVSETPLEIREALIIADSGN